MVGHDKIPAKTCTKPRKMHRMKAKALRTLGAREEVTGRGKWVGNEGEGRRGGYGEGRGGGGRGRGRNEMKMGAWVGEERGWVGGDRERGRR